MENCTNQFETLTVISLENDMESINKLETPDFVYMTIETGEEYDRKVVLIRSTRCGFEIGTNIKFKTNKSNIIIGDILINDKEYSTEIIQDSDQYSYYYKITDKETGDSYTISYALVLHEIPIFTISHNDNIMSSSSIISVSEDDSVVNKYNGNTITFSIVNNVYNNGETKQINMECEIYLNDDGHKMEKHIIMENGRIFKYKYQYFNDTEKQIIGIRCVEIKDEESDSVQN